MDVSLTPAKPESVKRRLSLRYAKIRGGRKRENMRPCGCDWGDSSAKTALIGLKPNDFDCKITADEAQQCVQSMHFSAALFSCFWA